MRWYVVGLLVMAVAVLHAQIPQNAIVWEANIPGWVDINAVASLKGGTVVGDTVKWTRTLEDYDRDTSGVLNICPNFNGQTVTLEFSLTSTGFYRIVAYSPSGDTTALLQGLGGWIGCLVNPYWSGGEIWQGPMAPWYHFTSGDTVPALHNPYADFVSGGIMRILGFLPSVAAFEFGHVVVNGGYSGPVQRLLYGWRSTLQDSTSVRMYTTFSKPIWVIAGMLWHTQADFVGYPEEFREFDTERNQRFSVAPNGVWDTTFSGERHFTYQIHGMRKAVLVASANNDNSDTSGVHLNGANVVSKVDCCSALTASTLPSTGEITLAAYTVWSWIGPEAWIITIADSVSVSSWWEVRDGQTNPPDSWDQNPAPMILKITPYGAVSVKEFSTHKPDLPSIKVMVHQNRIDFQSPKPVSFAVFDLMGRRVGSALHQKREGSVGVNGPGIYIWKADNESGKVLILKSMR